MQETKISDDSVSRAFSSEWRGPSFWAPALGRSGVAILCSEAYAGNVSVWQRDVSGRVLSLTVKFGTFKINLTYMLRRFRLRGRRSFRWSRLFSFQTLGL